MKITKKSAQPAAVTYGTLVKGDVFTHPRYDNADGAVPAFFIKTDRPGLSGEISIDLETGEAYSWGKCEDGFTQVVAEVVVHG